MSNNINKYTEFLFEKEFESITNEIFRLVEAEGQLTGDNTYVWNFKEEEKPVTFEWDFTKTNDTIVDKLKKFLEKLPKEKLQEYFFKFLNKLKLLPERLRRKISCISSLWFKYF